MTIEEKDILNERIQAAIEATEADYKKAQNQATIFRERYCVLRQQAINFHEQQMILLEAQAKLWKEAF